MENTYNIYSVDIGMNTPIKLGYDTYSEFIVVCENETEARLAHPGFLNTSYCYTNKCWKDGDREIGTNKYNKFGWIMGSEIEFLTVTQIGVALPCMKPGIVLSSFHSC